MFYTSTLSLLHFVCKVGSGLCCFVVVIVKVGVVPFSVYAVEESSVLY